MDEGVARIVARLADLQADPASEEHRASLRADIGTHGLPAFFRAAEQRLVVGAAPPSAPAGAEPLRAGSIGFLTSVAEQLRPAPGSVEGGALRQTWTDSIGSRVAQPLRVFHPGTLEELRAIVRLAATDRILEIAADRQRLGQAYLTSPFSLRFVQASKAYMSMMYGADTCMIEFPMLDHTVGGRELLQQIESEMYPFGGRPHWGLLNFVSGANGLIEAMYPMLARWLELFRQLGPNGAFDNAFTERCGFSTRTFGRA
jgi:hypothetical protein